MTGLYFQSVAISVCTYPMSLYSTCGTLVRDFITRFWHIHPHCLPLKYFDGIRFPSVNDI